MPRDFDAFEMLQKELIEECQMKLPDLPRKFHVFMTDDDVHERQVSFDCLLKVLAQDKEKCTCAPLLRFLQVPLDADKKYVAARKEYLQKKEKIMEKAQAFLGKEESSLFDECEKEPDPFPGIIFNTHVLFHVTFSPQCSLFQAIMAQMLGKN